MRIRTFFLLLTLTIGGLLFVVSGALIFNTTQMHEKSQVYSLARESISVFQNLKTALLGYSRDLNLATQTGNSEYEALAAQEKKRILEGLRQARDYVASPEENASLSRLTEVFQKYIKARENSLRMGHPPEHPSRMAQSVTLEWLVKDIDAYVAQDRRQAADAARAVSEWENVSTVMGQGAIGVVLFIGAIMVYMFRKQIYRPLTQLNSTIVSHTYGEIASRVKPEGPLEIRQIGAAFNEMADALAESKQRQLQFLAGVVHDLKNPLTAIKGYTDLLLAKNKKNEELAAPLHVIKAQIDRLTVMLQDLLDATSIEAGSLIINKSDLDLRAIVKNTIEIFASTSPRHTIQYHPPPEAINVRADEQRLEQVFGNLISNAIKYSPNGGTIQIRIEPRGACVHTEITDQGLGIAPAEFKQIFLPFARSNFTRNSIPGVGLGLSVSQKIVQAHEGKILVESMVGAGSTFTVVLPLANPVAMT